MPDPILGETAAILAAAMWTANAILFSAAGKRIGSVGVNAFRIALAVLFLGITHVIILGSLLPAANSAQWFWLGISGIVGLGIGDFALFAAYVIIGPKRSLLLMALAPVCSVVAGYFILEESLGILSLVGITITLVGITIVVLERKEEPGDFVIDKDKRTYGIILGIIGAVGQGVGLVISKYGMVTVADDPSAPLDSISATLIRMIIGAIFVWIAVLASGKLPSMIRSYSDTHALKLTSAGAFFGPFLGVWLSMVAITFTETGIAMTLMSLMPVIVIPLVWVLYKEKTSWRGVAGALVAVTGVAILFLL
ncbi:MAG: DMT family transporter [Thermoplasmata archaeon]|nr:MAG: DMT family transporter [Thermoplasmata archaeon]